MVMLPSRRCILLTQKIRKLVMNFRWNKFANHGSNRAQWTRQPDFSDDSIIYHSFLQRQESRSSQYGQPILNNYSSHRSHHSDIGRPISTFKINHNKNPIKQESSSEKYKNDAVKTPKIDARFLKVKEDPELGLRNWTTLMNESAPSNSFSFKIMSYNVLAQKLLHEHMELYPKSRHNRSCLIWENRFRVLKEELSEQDAHIICLQEVQESHYAFYNIFFKSLGYDGIFKKRTGIDYSDGCAIFYKNKYLKMVEHQSVEFKQSNSQYLDRNNVGLIAKFVTASPAHAFIVATTHLLFNPKREDVRLAQTQVFLAEINRFAYDHKAQANVPVILCGDFNALSTTANGVYQLLEQGMIDYANVPTKKGKLKGWLSPEFGITNDCRHAALGTKQEMPKPRSRSEEESLIQLHNSERVVTPGRLPEHLANDIDLFNSGRISHDFNFVSVYPQGEGVSTFQDRWIAVDYMFYSTTSDEDLGRLKLLGRYELPTEVGLNAKNIKGIPNGRHGSDHFYLVANFRFDFGKQ